MHRRIKEQEPILLGFWLLAMKSMLKVEGSDIKLEKAAGPLHGIRIKSTFVWSNVLIFDRLKNMCPHTTTIGSKNTQWEQVTLFPKSHWFCWDS